MKQMKKFIEWLSFHPSNDEIARALATEYLVELGLRGVRFGGVNTNDSITIWTQYGYPDADDWCGRTITRAEWHTNDDEGIRLIAVASKEKWGPSSRTFVTALRDHGLIQGYLIVEFTAPVPDANKHRAAEVVTDLCIPLALYLSFRSRSLASMRPAANSLIDPGDSSASPLTHRQLLILRGMVEGKTNHELATEMGFSVSTIRHETMRIYQELAVSDRKEAAKKAMLLSLV